MIAGAAAMLMAACSGAKAQDAYIGPFRVGDPNVFWSGVVVGGAMTGTYFAIRHKRFLKVPGDGRHFSTGAFALTTVGCMALSPIVAAAVVQAAEGRPLTQREALRLGIGCIIPILGPMWVDAQFDANPQWEARPAAAAAQ